MTQKEDNNSQNQFQKMQLSVKINNYILIIIQVIKKAETRIKTKLWKTKITQNKVHLKVKIKITKQILFH